MDMVHEDTKQKLEKEAQKNCPFRIIANDSTKYKFGVVLEDEGIINWVMTLSCIPDYEELARMPLPKLRELYSELDHKLAYDVKQFNASDNTDYVYCLREHYAHREAENRVKEVFSLISAREGRCKSEKEGKTEFFFPKGYTGPRTPDDPLPTNLGEGYFTYEEFIARMKEEQKKNKKHGFLYKLFHRGAH